MGSGEGIGIWTGGGQIGTGMVLGVGLGAGIKVGLSGGVGGGLGGGLGAGESCAGGEPEGSEAGTGIPAPSNQRLGLQAELALPVVDC